MDKKDLLGIKLGKMKARMDRFGRAVETRLSGLESLYRESLRELEMKADDNVKNFAATEEELKGDLDQAGKEYAKNKYKVERDVAEARADISKAEESVEKIEKNADRDIARFNEEKIAVQLTLERQRNALHDLYQEQKRHLLTTREKLIQKYTQLEKTFEASKAKQRNEVSKVEADRQEQISLLREQITAKKEGWSVALAAIQREYELLAKDKEAIEKKLATVRDEKEKELNEVRISLKLAKEQLEIDKATIVEKAEEDHRACAAEVKELEDKCTRAELELQNLILHNEESRKAAEEAFQKEEALLKETVKIETDKRDFEQKIFQDEKTKREKEIGALREEYDKKKWHWENQIRSLTMKKSVQEAEFDAERMRADREARVSFRSLEAKRDELKQRLADLKGRAEALMKNADKEKELMGQRWQWRRDRLWAMWQNRLDVIKKERAALQDHLTALLEAHAKQKEESASEASLEERKIGDLQDFVYRMTESNAGTRKQREIQIELEKTRLVAQIKECETSISDWMGRLKGAQDELGKFNSQFGGQMNFAERLFRDEEKETELFLHDLRRALAAMGVSSEETRARDAA